MRTSDPRRAWMLAPVALLGGCGSGQDARVLADVTADQVRAAVDSGNAPCALGGAQGFRLDCTVERIGGPDGETIVLGRTDGGYRRFRVAGDGRGVIAADGAQQARVTIIDDGMIEVAVGDDRYRLPATVRSPE